MSTIIRIPAKAVFATHVECTALRTISDRVLPVINPANVNLTELATGYEHLRAIYNDRIDVETYAGWIDTRVSPNPAQSGVSRDRVITFLPIHNGRVVKEYKKREALLKFAATCSCSVVATEEDKPTFFGVESAHVSLVPHRLGKRRPFLLSLSINTAIFHGLIHSISYHVTVHLEANQVERDFTLQEGDIPDPRQ